MKARAAGWGLAVGWIGILLGARHELIWFAPPDPAAAPVTYCGVIGYAKEADYAWYLMSIAGGCAGALAFRLLADRFRTPPRFVRRGFAATGAVSLIASLILATSSPYGRSAGAVLLWVLGAGLPWLDPGWYARMDPDSPGPAPVRSRLLKWTIGVGLVVLAGVATRDPSISSRPLDGIHEGVQSVFVQNVLAGDRPGPDFAAFYGPVQCALLGRWVRAGGTTLLALRWYFAAAVAAGTAVHLLLVGASAVSLPGLAAGAWLMVTLSVAGLRVYGWMDALRTAIPLAGVWLFMRGLTPVRWGRLAAGAGLLGIGTAYAQEFGLAGLAGAGTAWLAAVAWPGDTRDRVSLLRGGGIAVCAGLLGFAGVFVLLFGAGAPAVLVESWRWGYAAERLAGHGARPIPEFPWWGGPLPFRATWPRLRLCLAVWAPSLLVGAAFARTISLPAAALGGPGAVLLGWSVVLAVSHLTVIARPFTQVAWSAPALVLLFVALLTDLERRGGRGRRGAGLAAVAAVLWATVIRSGAGAPVAGDPAAVAGTGRLAGLRLAPDTAAFVGRMIPLIHRYCPAGQRMYFADPWAGYLPFVADRATLNPYPVGSLVISADGVDRVLRLLDAECPPLALIGVFGIDLPFAREHPREWAYLGARYRLLVQIRDTLVFVRR